MVSHDLNQLRIKKITDPQYIKRGIQSLAERKDIVIRPADKGGGLVILSKEYYQSEMVRLLSDHDTYRVLSKDPMLLYKVELHAIIEDGKDQKILNKKEAMYLDPLFCRTPIIYFLPKIHKDTVNPPGRPIVNGIDSVSARLGQYIDFFLQPLVTKTPAFLKDTKHIIQILEGFW